MPVPPHVQAMWSAFSDHIGGADEGRFYEAFRFGDSPEMADELAQLVLAGTKRATAGAVWSYEASGKGVPRPGHLSIVTNSAGTPLCVIETRAVEVKPFSSVTAEFAAVEGEGDGSLGYWQRVHAAYFTRECEAAGRRFTPDMLVAFETFDVVFPPGGRRAP